MRHAFHPLALVPIIFLVPVIGWGAFWFFTAKALEAELNTWGLERRAEGYVAEIGPTKIGGFPFKVQLAVDGVRIEAPTGAGGWKVRADKVDLSVFPWNFRSLTITPKGRAEATLPDTMDHQRLTLEDGKAAVTADIGQNGNVLGVRLTLDQAAVGGLNAYGPVRFGTLVAQSAKADFDAADAGTVTRRFTVNGGDIGLPADPALTLGRAINALTLDAELLGEIPPGRIVFGLRAWQESGGSLRINRLTVDWPPLDLFARGSLALNNNLQPAGSLAANIRGFFEAVNALAAKGVIRSKDASMARLVLGAMARQPEGGGPPEISLPFSIQAGRIYAGPVPLYQLPPISWEKGSPAGTPLTPGIEILPDGTIVQ